MQTSPSFVSSVSQTVTADAAVPVDFATDMERLALALLNCAEKCEIEAGLVLHITPALPVEGLARLAGLGDYGTALLLDYLISAGFVMRRRQRLVLSQPEALQRLALGVAPV